MIKQCVDAELLKGDCKINMKMCTTSNRATSWNEIDFISAEKHVKKLQKRISTAMGNGYVDKALRFQHVLIHSFYAKALAVKTVSMNRGKNTCGVDGIVWSSPSAKFDAIDCLHRRGYRHRPLLRVYKCESRKRRALGIPTMQDRAMQTLYKFALEPIAEVLADEHSYAYRKNRSVEDAILHCCDVLEHDLSVEWILKIDIKSCFDMISHEWLMNHIPMDKEILQKILKCGYIDRSRFYRTDRGIPQGGPISSVLCNLTLDGLEPLLVDTFGCDIHFVRYADDILIMGNANHPQPMQSVLPVVEDFLSERGLSVSEEKTYLCFVDEGAVFLGWRIYKEEHHAIAVPPRDHIDSLLEKMTKSFTTKRHPTNKERLDALRQILRGWLSNYRIAQPQALLGVEFDVAMMFYELTQDTVFADFVYKQFNHYYPKDKEGDDLSMNIYDDYIKQEANYIELLGYAKNHMIDARTQAEVVLKRDRYMPAALRQNILEEYYMATDFLCRLYEHEIERITPVETPYVYPNNK